MSRSVRRIWDVEVKRSLAQEEHGLVRHGDCGAAAAGGMIDWGVGMPLGRSVCAAVPWVGGGERRGSFWAHCRRA